MELNGRRVLITGASRGIGRHLAETFAGAGATVALVARTRDTLEQLAERLGGTAHPADLADRREVEGLVARVEHEAGPVDVLVNNAGVETSGAFHEHTAEEVERTYRVNLLTPAELCRQAIPGMLARGGGHLVNVSSLSGTAAFPGMAAYSSTKAGLTQLTAGLRADLRGLPVGTTVVELGPVKTDMLEGVESYPPTRASFERGRRLRAFVDLDPGDVAREVVDAVRRGKRHVRLPRRVAFVGMIPELPRRSVEILLTGIPPRSA